MNQVKQQIDPRARFGCQTDRQFRCWPDRRLGVRPSAAEAYAQTGLPSLQFLHISMLLLECSNERLKSL